MSEVFSWPRNAQACWLGQCSLSGLHAFAEARGVKPLRADDESSFRLRMVQMARAGAFVGSPISYETQAVQEAYEPHQVDMSAENCRLRQRADKAEHEAEQALNRAEKWRDAHSELVKELTKVTTDLKVADENLVSARQQRDDLHREADRWGNEVARANKLVEQLQRELRQARDERNELRESLAAARDGQAEKDRAELNREVAELQLVNSKLTEERDWWQNECGEWKKERDKLLVMRSELSAEHKACSEALAAGHAEVERLKGEIQGWREERIDAGNKWEEQRCELFAEIERLKREIEECRHTRDGLSNQNGWLSNELAQREHVTLSPEAARAVLDYLEREKAKRPKQWEPSYVVGPAQVIPYGVAGK